MIPAGLNHLRSSEQKPNSFHYFKVIHGAISSPVGSAVFGTTGVPLVKNFDVSGISGYDRIISSCEVFQVWQAPYSTLQHRSNASRFYVARETSSVMLTEA